MYSEGMQTSQGFMLTHANSRVFKGCNPGTVHSPCEAGGRQPLNGRRTVLLQEQTPDLEPSRVYKSHEFIRGRSVCKLSGESKYLRSLLFKNTSVTHICKFLS